MKREKNKDIHFRLSFDEELQLIKECQNLGFPDTSKYIRHILFRKTISTQNFREKTNRFYTHFEQISQEISSRNKDISTCFDSLKTNIYDKENIEKIIKLQEDIADLLTSTNDEIKKLNKDYAFQNS